MSFARAFWAGSRWLPTLFAFAALGFALSGCDVLGLGSEPSTTSEGDEASENLSGSYGACNPWFDNDVVSLDMSEDGQRWVYLSGRKPGSLPEDTSWKKGVSRALYVRDFDAEGNQTDLRYIALPWEAQDTIPAFATANPNSSTAPQGQGIEERMLTVQISDDGQTVAIGVTQSTLQNGLAKVYIGSVPGPGEDALDPGDEGGLIAVPVNSWSESERVQNYTLSGDGTKIAATVGERGELRIYDLAADQLSVYTLAEDNTVLVEDTLPPAKNSINESRSPAVITNGADLEWSPEADRVAIARNIPVSKIYVQIVDISNGETLMYAETENHTAAHVAWANDGDSVYVMSTELAEFESFGKTVIRHLEAKGTGAEIGGGASIERPVNWRTEPAHLTSFGDDATFLFVWEGQLWRLDVPNGDLSQASYQQVTVYGENVFTGGWQRPAVSLASDTAISIVNDRGSTHIGERREVTAARCSESATPVTEDGAAEEGTEDGEE